ncbi:Cof family protein [Streptococcus suis]|uniref:Cof family protein n=1 Tax=Streptococcus suis TaxID=1307 RepID=A0A0Z8FE84_STRSU|nr:HAD family hydrolase [Streptococcus suis]CYU78685.1 Cof family protein [Streptococcus suis]
MFQSKDDNFNRVKDFHFLLDGETQERPSVYDGQTALHRAGFKVEELVEFLHAASESEVEFHDFIQQLHQDLDTAVAKVSGKRGFGVSMQDQVDALLDILYFTYGSFVLMGVDPEPIFQIVHTANMGKTFPDGKAHFDPITHKILKPDDWEKRFAPEEKIQEELKRQMKRLDS